VADVPLVVRVTQFEKPSSRGLKKEHGLREFENRVRRILERKGEEVTGRWRISENRGFTISILQQMSIITAMKANETRWERM
jgi:hypothetical protein